MKTKSDELHSKLTKILASSSIIGGDEEEVIEVLVEDAGLRGQGIVSKAFYVKVKFAEKKPLNLFVKTHSPSATEMIEHFKAFEKEAVFFTKYIDSARDLCKLKSQEELLSIYPKCYYADNEMIVLENLVVDSDFVMVSKETMQNYEEAKFAVQTLAKHHAISLAMIKRCGGPRQFFDKFPYLNYEPFEKPFARRMMEPMMENGLNTYIQILERHPVEGSEKALEVLKPLCGKPYDVVLEMLKKRDERLEVLNHGDYWTHNMMFQRDQETSQIVQHKAIDMQVTRYGSPALDLGYYFFTSIQTKVRQCHFKELLQLYLTTLKRIAEDLDCHVDVTFEELFMMFKRKFKLGFWFAACIPTGTGMAVLKELDTTALGNMSDWAVEFKRLTQKWLVENPDKVNELAKEIVTLVEQYSTLAKDHEECHLY